MHARPYVECGVECAADLVECAAIGARVDGLRAGTKIPLAALDVLDALEGHAKGKAAKA